MMGSTGSGIDRRAFLAAGALAAGAPLAMRPGLAEGAVSSSAGLRLLSDRGCGRATGYAETNKIVTLGDRTHVAWLDSVEGGFRARIRMLDHESGEWSPTYTLGEAYDNHGGPALTADSEGYLHVVFYPHHHPFRYRRSLRPNDASAWTEAEKLGDRLTYPTLLCGADDTLHLTCRQSSKKPWHVNYYRRPAGGNGGGVWLEPTVILRSLHGGYAHFQEALAWGPDHETLHLACRIYERGGKDQTVGYMRSPDAGETWETLRGERLELPVTSKTIGALARGGNTPDKPALRCGAIAVDTEGVPHVLFSMLKESVSELYLATPDGEGGWRRRSLRSHLPKGWKDAGLTMPGGITFTESGRLVIVATAHRIEKTSEVSAWGHPSSEVVRFEGDDAGSPLKGEVVSAPDAERPHWLPNLERPTGHHAVPDQPGIIYTAGTRGEKNTQILANEVFWVR